MSARASFMAPLAAVVILAAACVSNQSGQATQTTSAATPTAAGPVDLVVGIVGEPITLDVHQRSAPLERIILATIHDGLVVESPTGTIQPGLAESWQFAPDGMSVTMKLRSGVKFHDGTPFNAAAVKFNYERQLDVNNEFYKLGTWRLAVGFAGNIAVPIQVVDDLTVRINFKQALSNDLNLAYMTESPHEMVSPQAVQTNREKYPDHPVGTGPYRFVSYERGQRIVLERNPDYWGTKAQYDRLIFIPITDPDARLAALKAGTIDINQDVSADQLQTISGDSNFTVYQREVRHIWQVLLNQKTVPELRDKRVRAALNYAVDKDSIVKNTLQGQGVVAKCFMSGAYGEWVNPQLTGFPFDLAKAKQLMSDAGFPDGKGFPQLTLRMNTGTTLAGPQVAMAEVIQANLKAIGVNIVLQPQDPAAWVATVMKGDFQMSVFSLSISTPDPDNAVAGYHSSHVPPSFSNYGYYQNAEYETLYPQSRNIPGHADRLQAIQRLQQIACSEDPAAIWVEHAKVAIAASKAKVKAVQLFAAPNIRFNYITRP